VELAYQLEYQLADQREAEIVFPMSTKSEGQVEQINLAIDNDKGSALRVMGPTPPPPPPPMLPYPPPEADAEVAGRLRKYADGRIVMDISERLDAVNRLGEMGAAAGRWHAGAVALMLQDVDWVRMAACDALGQMDQAGAAYFGAVAALLEHESDEEVVEAAKDALHRMNSLRGHSIHR
jgi:hypothetical protein